MRINASSLIEKKFPPTGRACKRNANIRQFAKSIDIDEAAAGKIYDGSTSSIRLETLENICRVLECTPNDILVSDNESTQKRLLTHYNLSKDISHKTDSDK